MLRLPHEHEDGPVTIIIKHQAKRRREQEFRAWLKDINAAAMGFTGFMGVQVIEPHDPTNVEYVIIVRFDTYANLKTWNDSDVRQKYMDELIPLTESEGTLEYRSGLEYWFTLPDLPHGQHPKKHKMAVVVWLALTPLILIVRPALEPSLVAIGIQYPFNTLVSSGILVVVMTYAVMPFMTSVFKKWMFFV